MQLPFVHLLRSLFLVAVASLAPLVPPLRLVAVVLVLDMWSVLGVTPFVSSRRVGAVCGPIQ